MSYKSQDLLWLFPAGEAVVALPNWRNPRLLMRRGTLGGRWTTSALFPAFRSSARIRRLALRAKIAVFPGSVRLSDHAGNLEEFVKGVFSGRVSPTALLGKESGSQKVVVELRDANGEIVAYLKYAEKPRAQWRLHNEFSTLSELAGDFAPSVLHYGELHKGFGLLVTPIVGAKTNPRATEPPGLRRFQNCLTASGSAAEIEVHPGTAMLRERMPGQIAPFLAPLQHREWPIVMEQGDLAPWNVRIGGRDVLRAFDWEYSRKNGLPFVDAAYYSSQVCALVRRISPRHGLEEAADLLQRVFPTEIGRSEAVAWVGIANCLAICHGQDDGQDPSDYLQGWRQSLIAIARESTEGSDRSVRM